MKLQHIYKERKALLGSLAGGAAVVACFVMFLVASPSSHADLASSGALMTGKNLALLCGSKKSDDQFACQNYIAGVIDYHRLLRGLGTAPSVDFCVPATIDMRTVRTVVLRYLLARSESHDFVAAPAVAMSLYNTWPCGKRR